MKPFPYGPLYLAPMAGFTDFAFRRMLERYGGVDLMATEMVHARGWLEMRRRARSQERLFEIPPRGEKPVIPLAVQLWDSDPEALALATRTLLETYSVQVVDLNFGCPVEDVVTRAKSGSWLLQFPERIAEIVRRVVLAAGETPVTAKIRLGLTADSVNALEVAQAIEESGASAITVHGRTAEQKYSGSADWEQIAAVKSVLRRIALIGNGDLRTPQDIGQTLQNYPVDGVMVGRAALNRPWIFRQTRQLLAGEPESVWRAEPSLSEQKQGLIEHFQLLQTCYSERDAVLTMRRFAVCYGRGLPNAKHFRLRIHMAQTATDFLDAVNRFFPCE